MINSSEKLINLMTEDNLVAWFLIINNGKVGDELKLCLKEYACDLNVKQIHEIRKGIENNLEEYQIKKYANPIFSKFQMMEIRLGFEWGLTEDKIDIYAKKEFSFSQMHQILIGLQDGLTEEQIASYANPKFPSDKMHEIRLRFYESRENIIKTDEKILQDKLRKLLN